MDISKTLEEIRERDLRIQDLERQERENWINMPAYETHRLVERLKKVYSKKKLSFPLRLVIKVYTPFFDNKYSWQCWVMVKTDKGKIYNNEEHKASAAYCETIFKDKSWKEETYKEVSFFSQPLGNVVLPPKQKKQKTKPAQTINSPYLIDYFKPEEGNYNPFNF